MEAQGRRGCEEVVSRWMRGGGDAGGGGGHALGGAGEGGVEEESFSDGMLLAWPSGPVVLITCDLNPLRCVTKPF